MIFGCSVVMINKPTPMAQEQTKEQTEKHLNYIELLVLVKKEIEKEISLEGVTIGEYFKTRKTFKNPIPMGKTSFYNLAYEIQGKNKGYSCKFSRNKVLELCDRYGIWFEIRVDGIGKI